MTDNRIASYWEKLNTALTENGYGAPANFGEAREARGAFPDDPVAGARHLFKNGRAELEPTGIGAAHVSPSDPAKGGECESAAVIGSAADMLQFMQNVAGFSVGRGLRMGDLPFYVAKNPSGLLTTAAVWRVGSDQPNVARLAAYTVRLA